MKSDGGLRQLERKHLPKIHWVSVETAFTESGIPDMNGCWEGVEFWIENKRTSGWALSTFKIEQVAWIMRRLRAGGRVFIATRRLSAHVDEIWLHSGAYAPILKAKGLQAARPILVGEGGPAEWPWDRIEAALLGARI